MEALDKLLIHVRERTAEIIRAKQQDIKIVGYTPGGYFPEELAHACGVIPAALLRGGDHEAVVAAGSYLARFLDTFSRAQIGYRKLKEDQLYRILDMVVAMIGDNHMRAIAESWEAWTDVEVFKLAVPANKTKHGFDYYLDATYRLKDKLESLSNSKLSEARLKEEINLHNKMRGLLNQLSLLRKNEHPLLSGKEFIMLNHASFFAERHTMITSLESALQESRSRKVSPQKGPRVMLIGSTLAQGDFKVVDLLEETGAAIVFEDFTEGMRPYSQMIDADGDLMQALAESYFMKRLPAAYARPSTRERFDYFLGKAGEFKADGIVWYSLLYRDIYDMEGFLFETQAKKAGFPLLKITSDYDYGEKEPMRTRIETFTEMIKKGNRQNVHGTV